MLLFEVDASSRIIGDIVRLRVFICTKVHFGDFFVLSLSSSTFFKLAERLLLNVHFQPATDPASMQAMFRVMFCLTWQDAFDVVPQYRGP